MDQLALSQYLEQAATEAKLAADEHYRALFDCFLATIPAFLHRTGELAPSAIRPPGFTSWANLYQFGVELGDECAATLAIYKYKKSLGAWKLKGFMCHVSVTQFYTEQGQSKTLPGIILAAKELWANNQKRLQGAQLQGFPGGDSVVQ